MGKLKNLKWANSNYKNGKTQNIKMGKLKVKMGNVKIIKTGKLKIKTGKLKIKKGMSKISTLLLMSKISTLLLMSKISTLLMMSKISTLLSLVEMGQTQSRRRRMSKYPLAFDVLFPSLSSFFVFVDCQKSDLFVFADIVRTMVFNLVPNERLFYRVSLLKLLKSYHWHFAAILSKHR